MAQTAQGAQRLMILKGKSFDTYTLKLEARKVSGTNAFIIPFAVNGTGSMLRAHIGALVNNSTVFEIVSEGSVANVSPTKRLAKPIETGKWYSIRLEVGDDKVDCYLDDVLLLSYTEPKKLIGIAGRDQKTGDLIVKMVNGNDEAIEIEIELDGTAEATGTYKAYTIASGETTAENSFMEPKKYVPVATVAKTAGARKLVHRFPKYSITVLRIPTKK